MSAPIPYYDFVATEQQQELWNTIVLAFASSRDNEWEVCEVPDGFIIDGKEAIPFGFDWDAKRKALQRAVQQQNLQEHVRVHITKKKGGHFWLQKIGAEAHPEKLPSEKIVPYWSRKKKI